MGWNLGSTAFFVAAVIIVWSSIFGLYKSEEKQTGVTWVVKLLSHILGGGFRFSTYPDKYYINWNH